MIKVFVGDNVNREIVFASEDTTLRTILEENNIDYARGGVNLDGSSLKPGDLDTTLGELGYDGTEGHNRCFLLQVKKLDNA